jgi:hypothetical protein
VPVTADLLADSAEFLTRGSEWSSEMRVALYTGSGNGLADRHMSGAQLARPFRERHR